MAGTILTPTSIWKDFSVEKDFNEQIVSGTNDEDYSIRDIFINGRTVGEERVQIFGKLVKSEKAKTKKAILYVSDLGDSFNLDLLKVIADKGYLVYAVDICGKSEFANYTKYPEKIAYANYEVVKENLYKVENDAKSTCWYEWSVALRYALAFLKSMPDIKKVGAFAVGESATAMWQVAGMDKELDCAVFALNTGWTGYRGIDKFAGQVEPQFSDEMFKYIAGIDPQSYAQHITCPTLILVATNSNYYDCDRAYDTVSHMKEEIYSAVNYSVGYIDTISENAFNSAMIFFDSNMGTKTSSLPVYIDTKIECVDGKIIVTAICKDKNVKMVDAYVCEQTTRSAIRCWHKLTDWKLNDKTGEYMFEYAPYFESEIVMSFVQITFKNGYSIGSNIVAKRFNKEEVALSYKSKLIYSSREKNSESVFTSADQKGQRLININSDKRNIVEVKKGPMGMEGVSCENGLLTFKINATTDKPQDDAMLMFDIYAKESGAMQVKLVCDYFGEKVEYINNVSLLGDEVWQNVQIEINKFKTEQGISLKSYEKVEAIEFICDHNKFLINNALWV